MRVSILFSELFHSRVPRLAIVTLIALVWSDPAFCREIHDAARDGDMAKVKALLKENPDLVLSKDNIDGGTPLHMAASGGHKDVVELLLANKAEVNAKSYNNGGTPLHWAVSRGHKDVVELLLANKAEVNATANGSITYVPLAFQNAVKAGDMAKIQALQKGDPDLIPSKDYKSITPLHVAAGSGHKDVAELLLANKAEVNAKNNNGGTPLHWAASRGHKDVVELLLANKAEVNAKDNERRDAFALGGAEWATRTWWNCCWPTRPRSMPRTRMAGRLCTGGAEWPQGRGGIAAGQQGRGQCQGQQRRDAFALGDVAGITRTWWNCCWPTKPRSMPRTTTAMTPLHLAASGESQGRGGIAAPTWRFRSSCCSAFQIGGFARK